MGININTSNRRKMDNETKEHKIKVNAPTTTTRKAQVARNSSRIQWKIGRRNKK